MAATARASFKVAVATALAVLVLACAVAPARHKQCDKYSKEQRGSVRKLLRGMKSAPVGKAIVNCTADERRCLIYSLLRLPGGPCVKLGSECTMRNGMAGIVRASLGKWRNGRHLVGECAPRPRCNDTHVLVRTRWPSPKERCVQAGHLLCACGGLKSSSPLKPFSGCVCEGDSVLQPAPFGGYECVRTCSDQCSPQPDPSKKRCVFPPLAVDDSALIYSTRSIMFAERKLQDAKGRVMSSHAKKDDDQENNIWDLESSQLFYRYLPEPFHGIP